MKIGKAKKELEKEIKELQIIIAQDMKHAFYSGYVLGIEEAKSK